MALRQFSGNKTKAAPRRDGLSGLLICPQAFLFSYLTLATNFAGLLHRSQKSTIQIVFLLT